MVGSSTRRIAISPDKLFREESGELEFEFLLPTDTLRASVRDELRSLYDMFAGGEILDLSDID